MMIWDRSIPGQTSFFMINPHLPKDADPEEIASKLLATMEGILSEMRSEPATGLLPDDTQLVQQLMLSAPSVELEAVASELRARARVEEEETPICCWCYGPIKPGDEYIPVGDDRDDTQLPDKPLHQECALEYDPMFVED